MITLDMVKGTASQMQHQRGQGIAPKTFLKQWQCFHSVPTEAAELLDTGFEGSKVVSGGH